jgi:hypothetical protein
MGTRSYSYSLPSSSPSTARLHPRRLGVLVGGAVENDDGGFGGAGIEASSRVSTPDVRVLLAWEFLGSFLRVDKKRKKKRKI